MDSIFKVLGTFGKGFGTVVGVLMTVVSFAYSHQEVLQALQLIISNGPAIISLVGAIIAAFGIGRKAGATLNIPTITKVGG